MNSHDVTVAGYLVIVSSGVGTELLSHRSGSRIPSFGKVLSRLMRSRSGRVGVVAGWAWLGMHFFAR
ncbi:MAG TPA: DUF6186 family protein [Actinomycetota bacterium]|jgi:hypothetical protein|nr:DUF6186 family protein [Actinomycetota bacterium]